MYPVWAVTPHISLISTYSSHSLSLSQQVLCLEMGSRGLLMVKGVKCFPFPKHRIKFIDFNSKSIFSKVLIFPSNNNNNWVRGNCSTCKTTSANLQSSLEPPDVPRLAETARITLTPQEVSYSPFLIYFYFTFLLLKFDDGFLCIPDEFQFSLCFGLWIWCRYCYQVEEFAPKIRQVIDWYVFRRNPKYLRAVFCHFIFLFCWVGLRGFWVVK